MVLHVRKCAKLPTLLPADEMLSTGIVDYALGAAPHTGAFAVVYENVPLKMTQLAYYKLGDGPFYVFYTPFHLPHLQIASTIGRAVLQQDATVAPVDGPVCEVVAVAKRDLKAGDRSSTEWVAFSTYGLIENRSAAREMKALPIGLSDGCVLRSDVAKDDVVSLDDIEAVPENLIWKLWHEQNDRWPVAAEALSAVPSLSETR